VYNAAKRLCGDSIELERRYGGNVSESAGGVAYTVISRVIRNISHFLLQLDSGSSSGGGERISGKADVINVNVRVISR
jgi:hypothetical protein